MAVASERPQRSESLINYIIVWVTVPEKNLCYLDRGSFWHKWSNKTERFTWIMSVKMEISSNGRIFADKGPVMFVRCSLSRYKLKFSPDKVDTMIVQAISLLDDVDKELNNYVMRAREWYGWHFPELGKIVTDNLAFVKTVKLMGR